VNFVRERLNLGVLWVVLFALSVLLSLLIVAPAYAATVGELEPASGTWRVYRGSGFATFVCSAASEEGAKACAEIDAENRRTTTRYQIRYPNRYVTATYTAPGPTPVNCVVSAWSEWTGGTWSACTNGTQSRQETHSRTIVTQPANGGTACPVLTESRPATQACTVEPPPTGDWVHCANQEDLLCSQPIGAYAGTMSARYGVAAWPANDLRWIVRDLPSGVRCSSAVFGSNPAPGLLKVCQVRGTVTPPPPPPPPPATGTAALTWTPPATMTDGTPAVLSGFRIRYGQSIDGQTRAIEVPGAAAATFTVTDLASGTWFFTVQAIGTDNSESFPSNVASKVIP
jgi:hypothetical protein